MMPTKSPWCADCHCCVTVLRFYEGFGLCGYCGRLGLKYTDPRERGQKLVGIHVRAPIIQRIYCKPQCGVKLSLLHHSRFNLAFIGWPHPAHAGNQTEKDGHSAVSDQTESRFQQKKCSSSGRHRGEGFLLNVVHLVHLW